MFSITKIYTFSVAKIVIFLKKAKLLSIFLHHQPYFEFAGIKRRFPRDKAMVSSQENVRIQISKDYTTDKGRP